MGRLPHVARVLWSTLVGAACGRVGFDPAAIDGLAVAAELVVETKCGAVSPAAAALAITNDGADEVTIVSTAATGGFTVETALPLAIPPGASAMLEVRPPMAVIGTDRPGDTKTGRLTITTRTAALDVALVATVVGAEIVVRDAALMPTTLDLVGSSGACPLTSFRIANTGTVPAMVELSASAEFVLGAFSGGLIDANSSVAFSLGPNTTDACSGAGTVTYTATGDVCETTPVQLVATFTITGASSCMCS